MKAGRYTNQTYDFHQPAAILGIDAKVCRPLRSCWIMYYAVWLLSRHGILRTTLFIQLAPMLFWDHRDRTNMAERLPIRYFTSFIRCGWSWSLFYHRRPAQPWIGRDATRGALTLTNVDVRTISSSGSPPPSPGSYSKKSSTRQGMPCLISDPSFIGNIAPQKSARFSHEMLLLSSRHGLGRCSLSIADLRKPSFNPRGKAQRYLINMCLHRVRMAIKHG